MKIIRNNMIGYHFFSLFLGVIYFYGSIYGYNFAGIIISPIFQYFQPETESIGGPLLINFAVSMVGSLLPALLLLLFAHFTLLPNTKLFLFTSSFGYIILSVWNILDNYFGNTYIELMSLYFLLAKALGGLCTLWFVCLMYLKLKPNKRIE